MVHCFSQSVFFFIIKPRNKKKRRGKNDGKEGRDKRWKRNYIPSRKKDNIYIIK